MKIGKVPTPLASPSASSPTSRTAARGAHPHLGQCQRAAGLLPAERRLGTCRSTSTPTCSLTGDIYSRGSWALRTGTRYKSRYRFGGNLDLSYSTLLNSDPETPTSAKQRNFFVRWNHRWTPRQPHRPLQRQRERGHQPELHQQLQQQHLDYLSNTFQSNIGVDPPVAGQAVHPGRELRHSQNTINRTFDITLPALTFNLQRIFPFQLLREGAPPGASTSRSA
jgi:hypothetical protein